MNSKNGIVGSSPSTAREAIAQGLDLSASLRHWDLTGRAVEYWQSKLAKYKPAHIARAFDEYWEDGTNFPMPAEIIQLIRKYILDEQPSPAEKVRMQLAEYEAKRIAKEKQEAGK